jgi:preprotein translocase subunit SecD
VLEPSSNASVVSSIVLLTPEGLAGRVINPFAGGYRRTGIETHGGMKTVHYRAETGGAQAYAATFRFPGTVTADLWVAAARGELVGARIAGTSSHRDPSSGATVDDGVLIAFEVTDPDSATNVVALPATPVADPVRPTQPPVDLQLEYQVIPSNGANPTRKDLDAIGVALRTRLDVSARPVKVDVVGQDRLLVTVCGTTRPDADRRLIIAPGALTVVPLPAADYGTTTIAGGRALPSIGGSIDPALQPVAPAAGLGLTTAHVDPTTGQRGLAFRLGNQASDAFRTYAAAHPREYVAIVLDGVVLATPSIEGATAKGNFVFTGDYTEAETRLLASYLYRDPLPFELRPTSDVEIPTRS